MNLVSVCVFFVLFPFSFSIKMSVSDSGIGFIGLGIMGKGMAARLLSQGIAGTPSRPLNVWNRTPSVSSDFQKAHPDLNVIVMGSAMEVVKASGVTYSMLSTPEAAAAVFNDEEKGTLAGVSEGKTIVDCATLAETDHQGMSSKVVSKGGRYLEAPVSGSKGPAATGTLVFLCGGSKEAFDLIVEDGLNAMGKASHFLGDEVGVGTRAKLVVNSVMGTMLAAFSEGIAMGEACGLSAAKMTEIFGQGACAAPMYALKGGKISNFPADHATNFPLKHAHKDMKLASDLAEKAGVNYQVNNAAEKLYKRAREGEYADLDFSAVFEQVWDESETKRPKK